jgi:hypothetical protein
MWERKVISARDSTLGTFIFAPENWSPMKRTKQPTYRIGFRTLLPKPQQTPGPNTYKIPSYIGSKIPNKQSSDAHAVFGRPLEREHFRSPRPAAYTLPQVDKYKNRSPKYTML